MTTLIAFQHDDWCLIAADSQTSFGHLRADCSPMGKIAINGKYLIAAAGTVRGMNIVQHSFRPPAAPKTNLDSFMVNKFVPALRKAFIESGYEMKENGEIASFDNDLIVAVNGTIYFIDEVYGLERNKENLHVSGTGRQLALGAAVALGINDVESFEEAVDILEQAVKTAIKFDIYSGDAVQVAIQHKDGRTYTALLDDED
jgi:ATP-dependent protease HslVU (ClpYQ) peptidase subunit